MITVTFASLMPSKPHHGQGFYFDGEYKGYIGTDADGAPFVFFKRPGFGKGVYEFHVTIEQCIHAVRSLATRIAYRHLMTRARANRESVFYRHVLSTPAFSRLLSRAMTSDYQTSLVITTLCPISISPRSVPAPSARNVVRSVPVALSTTTDRATLFRTATYPQPLTARHIQ